MDTLWQDTRYALRQLARSPGFTVVAVLTLGLGIGANSSIFSVVNAVLYRPIPVRDPSALVRVYTSQWDPGGTPTRLYGASSYPDYLDLRSLDVFAGVAAYDVTGVSLSAGRDAVLASAALVSANFFDTYGVRALLGRTIAPAEAGDEARARVAVLTDRGLARHLAGDSSVVGREVLLNGQAFVVVGVVPHAPVAAFTDDGVDLLVPLAAHPTLWGDRGALTARGSRWLEIIARLAPGVTPERAQAALAARGAQIAAAFPEESGNRRYTLVSASTLVGFAGGNARQIATMVAIVMGVVGMVLLIACANVANLLLARAAGRRRELAIRLSLGAGRWRVVRQLLTESLILALLGATAATVLAVWVTDLVALLPLPTGIDARVDARVLAFTAAVALSAGLVFGTAPALQATRPDVVAALKDGGVAMGGRSRLRSGLLVAQIALSLVLLVGAGLFLRTVRAMSGADPGFDAAHVLVARVNLAVRGYGEADGRAFYERLVERAAALPGVRAASLASIVPFSGRRSRNGVVVARSGAAPTEDEMVEVDITIADPGHFRTLGMPIVRGAGFSSRGTNGDEVVVNEAFVRRFLPEGEPLGRQLRIGAPDRTPRTVVGVVRDAQFGDFHSPPYPMIFEPFPAAHEPGMALHLRTAGDPVLLDGALRRLVRELDRALPLTEVRPLDDVVAGRAMPFRLSAGFMAVFGGLALLLAAVGLYGVVSFLVTQRTREIGIRMALGARRVHVARLVVRQGMRPALVGIAIGLAGALALTRVVAGALYGVRPWDPATLAAVASLLAGVGALASWMPARRAARIDPTVAMRAD